MCDSRKYPHYPHRRDWKFRGGGGSQSPQNVKQCIKLNWNFQRGEGGVVRQIPSVGKRGEGLKIF